MASEIDRYLKGLPLDVAVPLLDRVDLIAFIDVVQTEKAAAKNAIGLKICDESRAKFQRIINFTTAAEAIGVRRLAELKHDERRGARGVDFSRQKIRLLKTAVKQVCTEEQAAQVWKIYGELLVSAIPFKSKADGRGTDY